MNIVFTKTRPATFTPQWSFVTAVDQCYREVKSGVLFVMNKVANLSRGDCHARGLAWPNADVTLRPVNAIGAGEDRRMSASALCGSADWERLPDEDDETTLWDSGTKVGPVGAR